MRKHLGKRLAAAVAAAIVVTALAAGAAFAAPVLKAGQTSAPGMSGNCAACHKYAAAKPAPAPVLFSRPIAGAAKYKSGRKFAVRGYASPTLCSATNATITISVTRRNAKGKWVAVRSLNQTATVSATGKYAGKVNYRAVFKIKRLGRYRLRAKLAYINTSDVAAIKFSKLTSVLIKK